MVGKLDRDKKDYDTYEHGGCAEGAGDWDEAEMEEMVKVKSKSKSNSAAAAQADSGSDSDSEWRRESTDGRSSEAPVALR